MHVEFTMADFVLAGVTYAMLDGVIANCPALYASKVGKHMTNCTTPVFFGTCVK